MCLSVPSFFPRLTLVLHGVLDITPSPALPAAPPQPRRGRARAHPGCSRSLQWRIKGDGHDAARLGLPPSTLRSRTEKWDHPRAKNARVGEEGCGRLSMQ